MKVRVEGDNYRVGINRKDFKKIKSLFDDGKKKKFDEVYFYLKK